MALSYCIRGHLVPKKMRSKIRTELSDWTNKFEEALVREDLPQQGGAQEVKANITEAGGFGRLSRMYISLLPSVEELRGAVCSSNSSSESVTLTGRRMLYEVEVTLALVDEGSGKTFLKHHYDLLDVLLGRQRNEDVTDEVMVSTKTDLLNDIHRRKKRAKENNMEARGSAALFLMRTPVTR